MKSLKEKMDDDLEEETRKAKMEKESAIRS